MTKPIDLSEAIDRIFREAQSDLRKNLEADRVNQLPDSSKPVALQGGGTIPITFQLDNNGRYHYETQQSGFGVTVSFTAVISDPNATYSATLQSSDGGGGHWDNVEPNQPLRGQFETSFWHKTKITIDLSASVKNTQGHAQLQYSY